MYNKYRFVLELILFIFSTQKKKKKIFFFSVKMDNENGLDYKTLNFTIKIH